jgi:hypothetical protein
LRRNNQGLHTTKNVLTAVCFLPKQDAFLEGGNSSLRLAARENLRDFFVMARENGKIGVIETILEWMADQSVHNDLQHRFGD